MAHSLSLVRFLRGTRDNEPFQMGPDRIGNASRTGCVRVDQVVAIELGIQRHAFEEKGHEGYLITSGQPWEQSVVLERIAPAIPRWRFHPAEQDGDPSRTDPLDDGGQVRFNGVERRATQPVVRTQLEDQDCGALGQRSVEALEPIRCGIAAHALISHNPARIRSIEPLLQSRWKGVSPGWRHGEAVA